MLSTGILQDASSLIVIINGVGDGINDTVMVNPELGLKGEDDVLSSTSVMSSNLTFPSMLRNDNGKLWDGIEEHVLSK